MIPKSIETNFDTLTRAFLSKDVALLEVKDKKTGKQEYVIVAVNKEGEGFQLVPFAVMVNEDPFERYDPEFESLEGLNNKITNE
jgi:hypothetical protein